LRRIITHHFSARGTTSTGLGFECFVSQQFLVSATTKITATMKKNLRTDKINKRTEKGTHNRRLIRENSGTISINIKLPD
jgi:hypothetical protein